MSALRHFVYDTVYRRPAASPGLSRLARSPSISDPRPPADAALLEPQRPATAPPRFRPAERSFDRHCDRAFLGLLAEIPEVATLFSVGEADGLSLAADALTDWSPAGEAARMSKMIAAHRALLVADAEEPAPDDESRRTRAVFREFLEHPTFEPLVGVAGKAFAQYPYLVAQEGGVQTELPLFFVNLHPLASRDDAERYLAKLHRIPATLRGLIESLRDREACALVPPRFLLAARGGGDARLRPSRSGAQSARRDVRRALARRRRVREGAGALAGRDRRAGVEGPRRGGASRLSRLRRAAPRGRRPDRARARKSPASGGCRTATPTTPTSCAARPRPTSPPRRSTRWGSSWRTT